MKIKRILCIVAFLAIAPVLNAQVPTNAQSEANFDPETLTQADIAKAQVPAALLRLAAVYKEKGDLQRLEWSFQRIVALQPNSGDAKLVLAQTYAQEGKKTETYDLLLSMQKQGFGYDLENDKAFEKVADTRVWKYVVDNLKLNLRPFGEGKVAYTLPKGDHLYDSLAFDPKRKQLLVGSVRDGTVSLLGKGGQLQTLIKPDASNGLWSVYAMAVDADHDALYVASTAFVYFKGFNQSDLGKAGVFKFSLSSGKFIEKYLLAPDPDQRTLSTIAVGKNGQVFAADGLRNVIYRLDGNKLSPMVSNPKLTSLRGLAVSDDGKTLYFADYTDGVFGIDLAAGKGFDLVYDGNKLVLGGIDGLFWYDGTLVVIENGMSPKRVLRVHLGDDGRTVKRAVPIDAANPAMTLPTYGAIDGDDLYFIANSRKNEYDSYGTPKDHAKLDGVQIFRSNLRFQWEAPPQRALPPGATIPPLLRAPKPTGPFGNVESSAQSVPAKQ